MDSTSPWILDVTDATFDEQVLARSQELPVVIDFWAPWCGPCRQLGPLLEKLAEEGAGKFLLAKINIDESPGIAGEMRVSSIPAVFAVRRGRLVNQFVGLLPEPELRQWLAALEPSPAERLLAEAEALEASDPVAAETKLHAALEQSPQDRALRIALARVLAVQDRLDDAEEQIKHLEQQGYLENEAEQVKALCQLRQAARLAGDVPAAQVAAAAAPRDPLAQLKLAYALAGGGNYADALQTALAVVQMDRKGQGDPARQLMVDIFHVLNPDDPLVGEYRRKLSAALY